MERKLDILQRLMQEGEWGKALKLAAGWPRLGKHKEAIQKGWAAYSNPRFYRQINQDADALIENGITALQDRYS